MTREFNASRTYETPLGSVTAASNALSRLITLNPENMGKYQAAIRAMGE